MDHAEIQESKVVTSAMVSAPSPANPPTDQSCIWVVAASSPCSSLSGGSPLADSITLCPNVMELDQPAVEIDGSPSSINLSSGNDRPYCAVKPPPPPSRLGFMQSFVKMLLPQLKRIHSRSSSISLQAKFSAVREAADMSLALSARRRSNNIWSRALLQELSSSYSNKAGAMKDHKRYLPSCRRKVYARILRRCATRMRDCSSESSLLAMSTQAYGRARRNSHQASRGSYKLSNSGSGLSESLVERWASNVCCRKRVCICRVRHAMPKRRRALGLPSYLKVLRNSRVVEKLAQEVPAEMGSKASKGQALPHISKEQIVSLGGLVPGGHNMDVPLLFQEAADYIVSLQMQVEALQTLSHSVSL